MNRKTSRRFASSFYRHTTTAMPAEAPTKAVKDKPVAQTQGLLYYNSAMAQERRFANRNSDQPPCMVSGFARGIFLADRIFL